MAGPPDGNMAEVEVAINVIICQIIRHSHALRKKSRRLTRQTIAAGPSDGNMAEAEVVLTAVMCEYMMAPS